MLKNLAYLSRVEEKYKKGRGAQVQPASRFRRQTFSTEHAEGIDEGESGSLRTQVFEENARHLVNKVDSPDLKFMYSMNPYQGCEHGCVYCYARNTHEYYGFSAGLDFETKIIVKRNAARLLEQQLLHPRWHAVPIMLSGNTDCYQPLERTHRLTRQLLEVMVRYRHPVGIITKNSLISRDLDLLIDLASERLVNVMISMTTLDESLRSVLEPRTASAQKRLRTIETLATAGVPVGVMTAPIIPGLNHHEVPALIRAAADAGACAAGLTLVRLNGPIADIFENWLRQNFPDRFQKVWHQIAALHGGQVHDSQFGRRMRGEGALAESIHQLFQAARKKYLADRAMPSYNLTAFRKGGNLSLF